jgi:AcrR family transcriptional regulator
MRAMAAIRLDAEERRKAIIDAALPLFARKGFATTTTKELAEAAGVSEALIFKHFPSKAALYSEIMRSGCEGNPDLEMLKALPPSTETLTWIVDGLVRYFVVQVPADPSGAQARKRLLVASFLEDGEFARLAYDWVATQILPIYTASIRAAVAAGDIPADSPVSPENGFWFAEHLAAMLALVCLPGRSCVPRDCAAEDIVRQARRFILRGLGLREATIAIQEEALRMRRAEDAAASQHHAAAAD